MFRTFSEFLAQTLVYLGFVVSPVNFRKTLNKLQQKNKVAYYLYTFVCFKKYKKSP